MSHFMAFPANEESLSEKYGYESVTTCSPKSDVTDPHQLPACRILHGTENYLQ